MTKVADFQSEKARASTRSTTSPVVLYFLLTSLLQNPYADTNNFYIVKAKKCKTWATLNSFGRFFFVLASVRWSSFQIWHSESNKSSRILRLILGDADKFIINNRDFETSSICFLSAVYKKVMWLDKLRYKRSLTWEPKRKSCWEHLRPHRLSSIRH